MKQIAFGLAVAIAAFAAGCQDGTLMGPPASSNSSQHTEIMRPSPQTGTILLKGDVVASENMPNAGIVFHVSGHASYSYRYFGQDIDQTIEFSIATHAVLTPATPVLPTGSGDNQSTYSILTASKQGVIYIERECYIQELDAKLHMEFAIAEDNSLSVSSMWLGGRPDMNDKASTN